MKRRHWNRHKQCLTLVGLLLVIMTVTLQFYCAPNVTAASASTADRFANGDALWLRDSAIRGSSLKDNNAIEYQVGTSSSFSSPFPAVSIDILSIGSLTRPDYLQAQRETMGRYARFFVGVTEEDDYSEANCSISRQDAQQIVEHCTLAKHSLQLDQPYSVLNLYRQGYAKWGSFLSKKSNPGGWLCAQKRANDGLQIILQKFQQTTLPDYLLLVDDDSFVDVPELAHYLQAVHPNSTNALVMAGCLLRPIEGFAFPFGGFGTIMSKGALLRLLTPISCSNVQAAEPSDDDFVANACYRLQQNVFGERQFFREEMSVADLIHAYVSTNRFADHASWTNESSFCVHSDWIWGYFFNYYNIADSLDHPKFPHSFNRFSSYRLSECSHSEWRFTQQQRKAQEGQCRNNKSCPPDAHICHYVTGDQIREEGKRVYKEPQWVELDPHQQSTPIFLYPFSNHKAELESKHFLYDGIQASSELILTQDHIRAPVWMVDVRQAGLSSTTSCDSFVELVRSANKQKRIVIFVYWDDEPVDYFWDCYQVLQVLDSTTVFRYKRSIVQGRQWNDTKQFVEPGSVIKFGNWRDHSGRPVQHIVHGVRSDIIEGLDAILDGASLWEVERLVDLSQFWRIPGQGDAGIRRCRLSTLRDKLSRIIHKRFPKFWSCPKQIDKLRDAVSQVIRDRLSPPRVVFAGVTEHGPDRDMVQTAYLRQLLQSKIVVVSQKDNWEDNHHLMEALASGAMVMTDPMLTMPRELEDNVSIVVYRNLDELVTKAQYYLEHDEERIAVAKAGYNVAMNYYRSWHVVERMVSDVRGVFVERR